ncbi:MAG: translation initiation factor IF-2, partial [Candidatus Neomarinimicrobiota bacterium]
MADVTSTKRRIFQVAKELNISHKDIIELLEKNGVEPSSHMSPVDEQTYQLIIEEFEKDRQTVERYRKERVRKEIHSRKFEERLQSAQTLEIMMPDEQRKLEEKERARKLELEVELKMAEEAAAAKDGDEKTDGEEAGEFPVVEVEEKPKKESKLKLRRIDISEIESQIESRRRRARPRVSKDETGKEHPEKESIESTIKKTLAMMDTKSKKKKYKKARIDDEDVAFEEDVQTIMARDFMTVQELAGVLDVSPTDIITRCLELGAPATMNQRLDFDTIVLLAQDMGYRVKQMEESVDDLFSLEDKDADLDNLVPRAPVVTMMGHVDHGKTSLLDYVRNTNVVAGEAGSITQHIGAYRVELGDHRMVTFLDTPGHESFTAMRARGALVTDVVILIVAADDGVKPQTIEAIDHAKAADVPIVVAVNKIDKKGANPDSVKKQLSDHGILVEDWGGKHQCVEISAKTGKGVDELLELLALETDVLELKANPETTAKGTVIESRLDKGHGPIATILVQKGTLRVGDSFIYSGSYGKVRALMNERNVRVNTAGPSEPVQVLGFQALPQAGD